jgi:hypothetical protein
VKIFFVMMALVSVVSVLYELNAGIKLAAHNHYQYRYSLLDTNQPPSYRLHPIMGLTPQDLAKCDDHVAKAYRISVDDGYRLGTGYSALSRQGLLVSALLFLTSIFGIRVVNKNRAKGGGASDQSTS